MQKVAYDVRSLVLLNEGKLNQTERFFHPSNFTEILKQDIDTSLNSIYSIQNSISLS